MIFGSSGKIRSLFLCTILCLAPLARAVPNTTWNGVLRDSAGKPVAEAAIRLRLISGSTEYTARTSGNGAFTFAEIAGGSYELTVTIADKSWKAASPLSIKDGTTLAGTLELSGQDQGIRLIAETGATGTQASGGEHLSSGEVSTLPLNERDFSKLLLLAAGTMTDTNGEANFTQQFAVNGQRGTASVFAVDGADTTDPELGGAR